jgi:hypothetical protein
MKPSDYETDFQDEKMDYVMVFLVPPESMQPACFPVSPNFQQGKDAL